MENDPISPARPASPADENADDDFQAAEIRQESMEPEDLIRPVLPSDWSAIYQIYAWYIRNTCWNFEWNPAGFEEFVEEQQQIARSYPYYAAVHRGKVIGYGYAHASYSKTSYQFDADLTIYFQNGKHYGLPSLLLEALCKDLCRQNVHWLIACITAENQTSIDFHQRHGFVYMGELPQAGWKNGEFHGVVWYRRELLPASWFYEKKRRFIPRCMLESEAESNEMKSASESKA